MVARRDIQILPLTVRAQVAVSVSMPRTLRVIKASRVRKVVRVMLPVRAPFIGKMRKKPLVI